jgi:hypothetical protein
MPAPLTLEDVAAQAPCLGGYRVRELLDMYLAPMSGSEHARLRGRLGLSQHDLADRLGITQGTLAVGFDNVWVIATNFVITQQPPAWLPPPRLRRSVRRPGFGYQLHAT